MDFSCQWGWVMQDISPQRGSLKFNGYISYQTGSPLATQCDAAAVFHLFLSDWKQVCFHKMYFFITSLQHWAQQATHPEIQELHKDGAEWILSKTKGCLSATTVFTRKQSNKLLRYTGFHQVSVSVCETRSIKISTLTINRGSLHSLAICHINEGIHVFSRTLDVQNTPTRTSLIAKQDNSCCYNISLFISLFFLF